ncbi:eukaryotic translation initiation factor 4E-1A isoform X1 [Harpegnathos saltator]|uniref:eukaryotic translation initiation factor 4E-1A isoform X1 n=1 Tax=Harpegnathos saltator TaxID=610380 RepID=UPI0005917E94|nr:eukaryotic translation initiation factor 4E-1A isoform X1 [Harpegnathos saltator]
MTQTGTSVNNTDFISKVVAATTTNKALPAPRKSPKKARHTKKKRGGAACTLPKVPEETVEDVKPTVTVFRPQTILLERPHRRDMATSTTEEIEEIDRKQTEAVNSGEFPPEYLIKHPLQNTWTLWYYEPDKSKSWEESQREITSFDTAEDFWSLYNHIKTASELRQGCDYSMFKQGIRPMWEDEQNKCGGRWLINLDKKQRFADLDNFWLEILLCMIGEAFNEYSDDVCGAVVNIRPKGDKIGVWTSNANSEDSVMEIGRKLKERLRITPKMSMGYQAHKDTMVKAGSQTKNTYTL